MRPLVETVTERERIKILLGTTGSGKTYKLREFLDEEDRCLCFDPGGDALLESWGVAVTNCRDAVHLATKTPRFRIRMLFNKAEQFNFMCDIAMRLGNVTVAIDELALFCTSHWMPDNLEKIIRLGRKERTELGINGRVSFIGTTQRPPDVHNFILSQAKDWYIFQMHLPQHVDYLRKFVPGIERALNLKQGEFIRWTPQKRNSSLTEP